MLLIPRLWQDIAPLYFAMPERSKHERMLLHGNMYLQFKCLFDATASLLK